METVLITLTTFSLLPILWDEVWRRIKIICKLNSTAKGNFHSFLGILANDLLRAVGIYFSSSSASMFSHGSENSTPESRLHLMTPSLNLLPFFFIHIPNSASVFSFSFFFLSMEWPPQRINSEQAAENGNKTGKIRMWT